MNKRKKASKKTAAEPSNIDKGIVRRFRELITVSVGEGKKYRFTNAFAVANNLYPQNIVSILNHKQMLSIPTLKLLARNEGISLNWFLLGVGDMYLTKPKAAAKPKAKAKPAKKAAKKRK